ncbi:MAG: DNA recombination protein RmuC [Actinomycetota bacterium]|nr:DNA recombination protein RmuC [Actinomycetota bacterium]
MLTTAIVVVVLGLAMTGLAAYVGLSSARSAGRQADARLAQALEQQAAELTARLGLEREHTVRSAADMAAKLAGEKLGDSMVAGGRQIDLRAEVIDKKVQGIDAQLQRMSDLMASMQQERAEQHGQLITNLRTAVATNRELSETTGSLRQALASPKARGQWGERMADDVLRAAGMVEGISYRKQTGIAGGSIPDVTFLFPGGRELHMDVKFPIDNYLRHLEATTPADREATAKAFVRDVRNRVKELKGRAYIATDVTLDEVLLFIPNESVWAFIHEQDPGLIDVALAQKVVLCSPISLFAVLAVIRQAVDQTRLSRASNEILECLVAFRQQWSKYSDQMDKVERAFASTQKNFEELSGTRRKQLVRQLDRIDDIRKERGLPEPASHFGDGEGEVLRRSNGEVLPWSSAEAG